MTTTTEQVRRQYEEFPYPLRDPIAEAKNTRFAYSDYLDAVNHHCFRGRRDFNAPFRVLVAGGGTGDSFVFLAEQLAHTENEIVYIDLSTASSDIARRRLEAKGIGKNCRMILGSILDLPEMGLGGFDFINCTGVLHHLDDPAAGLDVLSSLLNPGGAMHLMVYGRYGRCGIYPMQRLMRILNRREDDFREKVAKTRLVMDQLPPSNWFRRTKRLFDTSDDTELFDLLLHCKDRPYSIPELMEWLRGAGLRYVECDICDRPFFMQPVPGADPRIAPRLAALPQQKRLAVGENAWGLIRKHAFWATKETGDTEADPYDIDNIPFFTRNSQFASAREMILSCRTPAFRLETEYVFSDGAAPMKVAMHVAVTPIVKHFARMIDNRRTLGEMVRTIAELENTDSREVLETFVGMVRSLRARDALLLRHKTTRPLRWSCDAPPPKHVPAPHLLSKRPEAQAADHPPVQKIGASADFLRGFVPGRQGGGTSASGGPTRGSAKSRRAKRNKKRKR